MIITGVIKGILLQSQFRLKLTILKSLEITFIILPMPFIVKLISLQNHILDCQLFLPDTIPMLTKYDIKRILDKNGYSGSVICLHSSFKSFGITENGPNTIIDGFLLTDNTILAPAFYYNSETYPGYNYERNGIDFAQRKFSPVNYLGLNEQIDKSMGVIPKTMLKYNDAIRSDHPCNSFVAIGKKARWLMSGQHNLNVYSAYKKIISANEKASIFLAGVSLTTCTPIHFAEEKTGKRLFRRWVLNKNKVEEVEVGGCSEGFENLRSNIMDIEKKMMIGASEISVFAFRKFIDRITEIFRENPEITRCNDSDCLRCRDMIAGGPDMNSSF